MKKIVLFSIMFTMLLSACKKKDTRPDVLHISGIVTDKETSNPKDSVSIELSKSDGFSSRIILDTYSTDSDGKFSFKFSQNKISYSYYLIFSKKSYTKEEVHIDKDKEKQNFNIQLIKDEK